MQTIVSNTTISMLLAKRPTQFGDTKAVRSIKRKFGLFEPSKKLLRDTINAVFWTSMSSEEGKPALCRVQLADPVGPQLRFAPHDMSTAALRKLSPLLDAESNTLYVRKDGAIVGVGPYADGISVVAHRPGKLTVADDTIVLGVFDQGEWIPIGGSELNLGQILQRALPGDAFPDRLRKALLILRLAMTARSAGRGATLVLLHAGIRTGIQGASYDVESFPALPETLKASIQAGRATPSESARMQLLQLGNIANAVAGAGAGIDGATLIDDEDLKLLAFGAKIDAPDDNADVHVIELPAPRVHTMKIRELGGMRHQTAARLVQVNHDAMAITVSQDGPISLFAWAKQEATVAVMKHLDRYLPPKRSI